MDNTTAITTALQRLLAQPEDALPFVIVENAETRKFVQFTGSLKRPLLLDLPAQTLSEAEFYRAVTFFRRHGVVGQEYELLDAPGGLPVTEQFSFQLPLGSIADAAEVTLSLFDEVYHTPGCNLTVESG
jgi:hypothetical protein